MLLLSLLSLLSVYGTRLCPQDVDHDSVGSMGDAAGMALLATSCCPAPGGSRPVAVPCRSSWRLRSSGHNIHIHVHRNPA